VLSWWGRPDQPGTSDTQGISTDEAIPRVLDAAQRANITIAFHLEPYGGRSVETMHKDIWYLHNRYGHHPALYRRLNGMPLYYVYDSYHISATEWLKLLGAPGHPGQQQRPLSLRGTEADATFLGLWLHERHGQDLVTGAFDGGYTYFASNGFAWGSTTNNWAAMSQFMQKNQKFFIPSVGPGYDDTRIRPWNKHNTKSRENGKYFDTMWQALLRCDSLVMTPFVSITSYNEWGEGTQIEPAKPFTVEEKHASQLMSQDTLTKLQIGAKYKDYSPRNPSYYLESTKRWHMKFKEMRHLHLTSNKDQNTDRDL